MITKSLVNNNEYLRNVATLSVYNDAYRRGKALVTDDEYDEIYEAVQVYEAQHPEEVEPLSPTQSCGDTPIEGAGKIAHSQMFSMTKIKTKDDIRLFFDRCRAATGKNLVGINMEDKIDGLAMSLTYQDGKFMSASLRGDDGLMGDDVTEQAKHIKGIPMEFKRACACYLRIGKVEIRGEAYVSKPLLQRYNESVDVAHRMSDERSMAVGAVRSQDPSVCSKRGVEFRAYYIIFEDESDFIYQVSVLEQLKKAGFRVPYSMVAFGVKGIVRRLDEFRVRQQKSAIPTDGVVLKINNREYWSKMGCVGKYPKWGCAYKFDTNSAVTHLLDIEWNVSPKGKLCPKAIFEPVRLYGRNNDCATLHSARWVEEAFPGKYHVEDTLTTTLANMIIPKVVGVVHDGQGKELAIPKVCPLCGELLYRDGADYFCKNDSCQCFDRKETNGMVSQQKKDVQPNTVLLPSEVNTIALLGKNVVVSGSFAPGVKDELKSLVMKAGGNLRSSVNAKTSYLVCGDTGVGSCKLEQAQKFGVRCISKDEFVSLICK